MKDTDNQLSDRYWDPVNMVWRIKPTLFIEIVLHSGHYIAQYPQYEVSNITNLEIFLSVTKEIVTAKTIAVWLIREKTQHSPLYLTYLQSKGLDQRQSPQVIV